MPEKQIRNFKIGKIRSKTDRTVSAVISSEYPVKRYNGNEILVHEPGAVDLSRAPLPLIVAHDDRSLPVGIVEDLAIQDRELHGMLRFSKSQDAVWQDVQDGILRSLSVGYITQRQEEPKNGEYRVTKWQPFECSLVAAPADINANIKRNMEAKKMDINDLKKERKTLKDSMKEIAQTRDISDKQKTELETMQEKVRTLNLQISVLDEKDPEPKKNRTVKIELGSALADTPEFRASPEYAKTYDKFLRFGKASLDSAEFRTLTLASDVSMGFAVPEEFETKMVKALENANIMRTLCKVIKTKNDRKIPVLTGNTTANWINENGSYTASDITVGQKFLEAYKLGVLTLASEELVQDSAFDLSSFLSDNFGTAMGAVEEAAFVSGVGPGKPAGVIQDAETGVTSSDTSLIAPDELIDLVHSLKRQYRKNAIFLMNDSTLAQIRKIKDSNSRYIWQESLKSDAPSTLLGRPVYISEEMPTVAAGEKVILFGDLSYYWICDRTGKYFQELRERYAELGQVGFRANQRVDGILTLPEACKLLVMKA